jgi:hypothetical protein
MTISRSFCIPFRDACIDPVLDFIASPGDGLLRQADGLGKFAGP